MRDLLKDIVEHTYDLGCIEIIKITDENDATELSTLADDKSVVIFGKVKNPVKELAGTFGLPNLAKLKILLNIPEYKQDAVISVTRKEDTPVSLNFRNKTGDFKNDYRFMANEVVADKLKTVKFRGADWNIVINPTIQGLMRFKSQASANSEENTFQVKVVDGDLIFSFGDKSSHSGEFVFHPKVTGSFNHTWSWPIKRVISILELSGDKTMKISDAGALEITVDSGIAEYTYLLPAMSKR